jgi:hypothetical protein
MILSKKEEDINAIVQEVQLHPLNTDWKALSEQFGKTESYLRNHYNEAVSPIVHVRISLEHLSDTIIQDLLDTSGYDCTKCHRHFYSVPKQWEAYPYCEECHILLYREEITARWLLVNQYAQFTSKDKCNICDIQAIYNKEMGNRFHFDHLNMFEKSESVCVLVQIGRPMTEIYQEMDQCQVLCVSCHRLVTELERRSGFTRLKNNMTRDYKKSGDDEKHQEIKEENLRTYSEFMTRVYDLLRQNLQRRFPPVPLPHAICTDADEQ